MCPNWVSGSASKPLPYLIVGAGLAGLTAAGLLRSSGAPAPIIEAGPVAGGRLATFSDAGAVFDHGAQFFTVREKAFASLVETWLEAGVIAEWSRGFATADGSYYADGHPRYRASGGMASLAGHLARGLEVHLNQQAVEIAGRGDLWFVSTAGGRRWVARTLLLTPPIPQSLALLDAGASQLPHAARAALGAITYEPCIAMMLQLDGPSQLPDPGGMWPLGEPLAWMADNHQKGISAAPGAITLHAGPEFSHAFWDAPDGEIAERLMEAAGHWLGPRAKRNHLRLWRVRRWRYSKPLRTHPERCLYVREPAPLVFAGDAFAGPRVEGAVLSGLAAAERLLT